MKMSVRLAILSIVITIAAITSASAQSSAIIGVYGRCNMACRYIKINPDFTFEELLDGDLFNGQRKIGSWKLISNTKISAQSERPESALQVRESVSADRNSSVTVVDVTGAAVSRAKISGSGGGRDFECTTNEDGDCEIPRTLGFELEWEGFRGNYQVKNPASNRFQVTLSYEQMDRVIDEIWMIKGNHLYVEHEGAFDKTDPLERVPSRRARKLFPPEFRTNP